ncbi:MAG: leucine-rich repeat protein [Oscillospiraceae bacterium]|nr:leucine-rich repeat protein [Oscillospiraceae bacterium]
MKRIAAVLTACILCFGGVRLTAAADAVYNDFTYVIKSGTVTITGYTGEDADVVVPETINGVAVTRIGSSAFEDNLTITNVVLPGTIEAIEYKAFAECKNLETINFPDPLATIGNYAFTSCLRLQAIDLKQVESIGDCAFQLCISLKEIVVPGSVSYIPDHAFQDCSGVTSLIIEEGIMEISEDAALNMYNLKEITIPASVTVIGAHALGFTYYDPDYTPTAAEIHGMIGSAAESYAKTNGFDFIPGPMALGDLNGDGLADANDAAMLLVAAAARGAGAPSGLVSVQETAADADKNGDYDASDAAYILEYAAKAALGGMGSFESYMASR